MAYTNFQNCTANEYKNIVYNQETHNKIKILFNNVDYFNDNADEYCESFEVTSRVIPNGSKIFMLENLVSQEATLVLHNIDTSIIQDQVSISIGTLVSSNSLGDTYEYVPIGIYNLQEIPTTDNGKTTIKLRDNSVKLDFNYNAKPLIDEHGGTATKLQILQDICTKAGITCNVSSFIGSSDLIGIYDNTITGRQYVAYLAGSAGAIPIITRSGALDFKYLNNLSTIEIPIEIVERYTNAENFKISRVLYEDAIRKYESGNETYDTLFLDSANPYISSQEQVASIYNIVNNFEINSFKTGRILGNPAIDSYDLIQITDYDGTIFKTFANNTLRYNGKMINTFASEISFERKKENVSLKSGATFKKWAKTEIDNANAQITIQAGQIDEIEQELSSPTSRKTGEYFDLQDALDEPLVDFSMEGDTQQDSTSISGGDEYDSPSPNYPQDIHNVSGDNTIEICGKNLFDKDSVVSGFVNTNGTIGGDTNAYRTSDFIPVKPDTTYYKTSTESPRTKYYDSNKQPLNTTTYQDISIGGSAGTFTTPNNAYYLRFSYPTASVDANNIMVHKGSTATTYEAYKSQSYTINLGNIELCKIGDYQDYIYKDNDRWFLHKEIGKYTFDGTESWSEAVSGTNTNLYYSQLTYISADVLSNYFTRNDNLYNEDVEGMRGVVSNNRMWFRISNTTASDSTAFKTWLSTHNTDVYYVLDTPTDTEITNEELLGQLNNLMNTPLLKGLNHITNDTANLYPNLNIEYVRDTALNENYVKRPELNNYYTKSETTAQIQINNSSIQQSVAEIQTTLDSEGNAISSLSNQVTNLQTSTSQQINVINQQLIDGVEKVKTTTGYTFDSEGMSITKGDDFKNLITDRNQQISSHNKEIMFMGYDDTLQKTVARIEELESRKATIGVHRCETLTRNNKKRTAWFYVGGGN